MTEGITDLPSSVLVTDDGFVPVADQPKTGSPPEADKRPVMTVAELKRLLSQVSDNTPVIVSVFADNGAGKLRTVYDTALMKVQPVSSGSRGLEIAIEVEIP